MGLQKLDVSLDEHVIICGKRIGESFMRRTY